MQVILTSLFLRWSGMASLGAFYLLLLSPIVTGIMTINLYLKRDLSRFHKVIYFTSLGYLILISITFVTVVVMTLLKRI